MAQGPRSWFPFYFGDFFNSPRVQLLGAEGQAYYLRLLAAQWQDPDCLLPADDDSLAVLSGAGDRFIRYGVRLHAFFDSVTGGIRNDRCYREWLKSRDLYEARRKQTASASRARWSGHATDSVTDSVTDSKPQPQPQEEKQSILASGTAPNGAIDRLWSEYLDRTGRDPRLLTLTPLRRAKAAARWREALAKAKGDPETAEQLMQFAVARLAESDWHMGRDAKTCGKKYCDWETNLFRSAEQFERWLARPAGSHS